ncbi:MAG: SpoIIE family protein phosphatase, partial [Anaeroplasmataceae bacterium]|nr:SpoIIE family protein phosphatase [Anaeroplasmataceae bacterium]
GIYGLLVGITKNNLNTVLLPTAISFFPPSICFTLNYHNLIWIPFSIYSFAVLLIHIKDKKINIENDYINTLFDEFNKYLDTINLEFNKNNELREIKKQHLEGISNQYCKYCNKHTLCKTNIDKRYSFISAGMLGLKQNTYDCPYYNHFSLDHIHIDHINRSFEYSGIKSLGFELSYLYNQSIALKKEFKKFIRLLNEYAYIVLDLDINMACSSLYFSIQLDMQKPIIENLLLKCAYKSFGEELMLKVHEDKIYFFKKPQIKITYAHTVLAKEGNLMSGDNYFIKKDYNSSYIFALSDGMGSGYNAYTESTDALKMISNLSSYHFRIKTILKLLEDIYELKSNYDRYATLDFLSIDTANRKMNLYKMGSSTTYILHNNKLITYENQALPLKLDEVNSAYELDIFSGDYIFLLSDGVGDFINHDEFYSLVQNTNQSADEACYNIIEYIKRKEKNNLKDDLSLIVIKAI